MSFKGQHSLAQALLPLPSRPSHPPPFLFHTPSKEEGKHRTEGKEGKVCCSHLLAPLLLILTLSSPNPLPQRNPKGAEATRPTAMSKSLKKKSHWTSKVHESVIGRNPEGQLGFELKGGAENGQFPYLGEVKPGKVAYESGSKLVSEELLLEVNETPVAGLTIRDVLAVIKHCKDPLRLKCVKQGERSGLFREARGDGGVGSLWKGVCCTVVG